MNFAVRTLGLTSGALALALSANTASAQAAPANLLPAENQPAAQAPASEPSADVAATAAPLVQQWSPANARALQAVIAGIGAEGRQDAGL